MRGREQRGGRDTPQGRHQSLAPLPPLCVPEPKPADPHRKLFLAQPRQDWDNAEPASVQDFRVQTSLSESPTRISLGCVVLNILLSFSEL